MSDDLRVTESPLYVVIAEYSDLTTYAGPYTDQQARDVRAYAELDSGPLGDCDLRIEPLAPARTRADFEEEDSRRG